MQIRYLTQASLPKHMGGFRGGTGDQNPEKSQKYRVSKKYWSGSPENHKATKPAFNFWPLSARQLSAIQMAFCWRVDDGPLKVAFVWILSPL